MFLQNAEVTSLLLQKLTSTHCSLGYKMATMKNMSAPTRKLLTLRLPSTTIVPYANSLDPDETASNLPSHPDPSCLTLRQDFHKF